MNFSPAIIRNVAVWNTAFLGDAVLTLPLLQSVKQIFPAANLDFYVRGGLGPLFATHPDLRAVYEYDKSGREKGPAALRRKGSELAARGYDLWIGAHPSLRSAVLARASGAASRIGYAGKWFSFLYTNTVDRRFGELAEVERLLELLTPLSPVNFTPPGPRIYLPERARKAAEGLLPAGRGRLLGLHPGSVWPTKRWLPEYFAEVAIRALEGGARVALFAGPGEEDMAALVRGGIVKRLPGIADAGRFFDLSGRLALQDLAACIARLDLYLTNDSGPMHLAWVQDIPVTAVFGPTVEALGFFPRGPHSTVLQADLPCRPCGLHGPRACPLGHHDCMRLVTPDMVWEDVRRKLGLPACG